MPRELPGEDLSLSSRALDMGAGLMQSFKPMKQFSNHVCGFYFAADDQNKQLETHHYVAQVNEDVWQCLVYDSDRAHARLMGVEYIVSESVFTHLPEGEKKLW
ncbi:unnamed protein product [Phaeothamnion confervicola]